MKHAAVFAAAALVAFTLTGNAQQTPPRAAVRPAATGTSAISGTVVVDDETRRPARRARVTLRALDDELVREAVTDEAGRFSIDGLPAGRYGLHATKPGYVRTPFGASRLDPLGTPIVLSDAQHVESLTVALPPGAVITGTVTDETGAPAFGVQVQALSYSRRGGGELVLAPALAPLGRTVARTDDRGVFRLYGLVPGSYVVAAVPTSANASEIQVMTAAEIAAALESLRRQPGAGASANPWGAQPETPAGPEPVSVGYSPVYYPGTSNASDAETLTIRPGEERTGVNVQLRLVRTTRIQGTVLTPPGVPPETVHLVMLPADGQHAAGLLMPGVMNMTSVGPDGSFSYSGVAPGRYLISARGGESRQIMSFGDSTGTMRTFGVMRAPAGAGRGGLPPTQNAAAEPLWGQTEIMVDGLPLTNVVIAMQPGMTLSGRLVFEGANPPPLRRTVVTLVPATDGVFGTVHQSTQVDERGAFSITGLTPGRYRLSAQLPVPSAGRSPWMLKSAIAGGRDAFDVPLDIAPGEQISDAVITFTTKTQEVTGMLQNASGQPAPDFTIVVFSADRRYWTPLSRRIRTGRSATDGGFVVRDLPAGDYRIAAVVDISPADATDPAILEQLFAGSLPIQVREGERTVQNLRIGG